MTYKLPLFFKMFWHLLLIGNDEPVECDIVGVTTFKLPPLYFEELEDGSFKSWWGECTDKHKLK